MQDALRDYLREMTRTPFSWERDAHCAFAVADWAKIVTGADPVPEWRGLHGTQEAWRAAVEREGGLARLIARIARRCGAKPTRRPQPGDFGVIRVGDRQVSVIMTPTGRWAGKSPSGLMVILKGPRMAWTLAGR